jgi:glutathione S-transferase
MPTIYGMAASGNCWKARQILELTGRPVRWVEIDSNGGQTRSAEFLAINPFGKVPVVVLEDGTAIAESNAILAHFGEGTRWLPPPGLARTRVFEWLFFEQYSHEPYIAVARNIRGFLRTAAEEHERLARCDAMGARALDAMEHRLSAHPWLTDAGPSVADIALFAYTHVADQGGFELARWPGVAQWVARLAALPGIRTLA